MSFYPLLKDFHPFLCEMCQYTLSLCLGSVCENEADSEMNLDAQGYDLEDHDLRIRLFTLSVFSWKLTILESLTFPTERFL